MIRNGRKPSIFAIALGLVLVLMGLCMWAWEHSSRSGRFGQISEDVLVRIPRSELPENTLFISSARRSYGGGLTLSIPAIGLTTPVGDSTREAGLREMPGLYEFSQMPGEDEGNVSIAGHRDIYGMEFYSLDKLTAGDCLYLVSGDMIYRYEFKDSAILPPDHWEAIEPQGFSCLTLTTCDPIGTTVNRLILRAELAEAVPYSAEYPFVATTQGLA